jgi:ATP-dependent Clp protease ATP-binding subunit ClpB
MKKAVMEVVGQHFRPEFINRVDDIVVFHPLTARRSATSCASSLAT